MWNLVISIQYVIIKQDEKCSSTHKNIGSEELLALWASFKQVYINAVGN